jgi:hypothetical protein
MVSAGDGFGAGRDARLLPSGQQGEDPGDGGGAGAYAQTGKGVL